MGIETKAASNITRTIEKFGRSVVYRTVSMTSRDDDFGVVHLSYADATIYAVLNKVTDKDKFYDAGILSLGDYTAIVKPTQAAKVRDQIRDFTDTTSAQRFVYKPPLLPTASVPVWVKYEGHSGNPASLEEIITGPYLHLKTFYTVGPLLSFEYYKRTEPLFVPATGVTVIKRCLWNVNIAGSASEMRFVVQLGTSEIEIDSWGNGFIRVVDSIGTIYGIYPAPAGVMNDLRITGQLVGGNCVWNVYLNQLLVATVTNPPAIPLANCIMFGLGQGTAADAEDTIQHVAYDVTGAYTPAQKSDADILDTSTIAWEVVSVDEIQIRGVLVGKRLALKKKPMQPGSGT